MGALDATPAELEALLGRQAAALGADLAGPVTVLARARRGDLLRCEVSASRLVPVDPTDPALGDLWVAVPVAGWVELRPDGSLGGHGLPAPDPAAVREARAFVRDLIGQGAVRGLGSPPGPGRGRPTHEVRPDAAGRRVIRRIGFAAR